MIDRSHQVSDKEQIMRKAMDTIVILVWLLALLAAAYALSTDRMTLTTYTSISIAVAGARNHPSFLLASQKLPRTFAIGAPTVDTVSTPVFDIV